MLLTASLVGTSAAAVTRKRVVKVPAASKVVPLPPTTAPVPVPLPPTTPAPTAAVVTTVAAPSLTLTADAPRKLVAPGGSVSFTLTVASKSSEASTLSVSGLPAGVRANIATQPAATTSVLTLTTSAGITPGGYNTFKVQAQSGGTAVSISLDVVVDTTQAPITAATTAPGSVAFSPTAEVLSAGPLVKGGGNFVVYRVNLNRPAALSGAAAVSLPLTQPGGLAGGISESSVVGPSFIVSFSAPLATVSGFYQPTVNVTIGGYSVVIAFPAQVT